MLHRCYDSRHRRRRVDKIILSLVTDTLYAPPLAMETDGYARPRSETRFRLISRRDTRHFIEYESASMLISFH